MGVLRKGCRGGGQVNIGQLILEPGGFKDRGHDDDEPPELGQLPLR